MKNIKQFIIEKYDSKIIQNVKIIFDVFPREFYLNAPENYSEDDLIIYLGDVLLEELPADNEKYKKLFGKNINNINDVYFEYDKFEHLTKDKEVENLSLEWDQYYDEKNKSDIDYFKITNLKYIILFDEFEILDDNNDDVNKTLNDIFSKLDSSRINKYPVDIKYNSELLEYSE